MSTDKEPPPQPRPPDELDRDLRGGKAIFFTLDTLFDRDFATERGLIRCKQLIPKLRGKSMDELKRAYHHAMAAAYLNHIHSQIPRVGSQRPVDKVEMMFRELNLNPPSWDDKSLIGKEFGAEFRRNRFEVLGASQTLAQLKNLDYAIVVADDDLEWDAVEDLNFWQYVDANIITKDPVMRKPDLRVFKNALDACGVSPKNAVIVGCSIQKDISGILNAGAEPILYMPNHKSMEMDVQGTRVLVVRTMVELLSEISRRPENRYIVTAQRHQLPPPSRPPAPHASQAQGYTNDQNGGSSSQHHYQGSSQSQRPPSDPKPIDDGHETQSREKVPLPRILSQPGSSDETPRRHSLPGRAHPTKYYERISRPVPTLSCTPAKRPFEALSEYGYVPSSSYHEQGYPDHDSPRGHHNPAGGPVQGPSAQTSSHDTPKVNGQLVGPNSDSSDKSFTRSSSPFYNPPSPTLPTTPPPRTVFPFTEDYGITRATYGENWDQPRSHYDGYGHGTSRNGYSTHGGYTTLPSLRSWYPPPIPNDSTYRERSRGYRHGNGYEISGNRYSTRGSYAPRSPSPRQAPREMSQQIGPSRGMYGEHGRQTFARRTVSMYEATPHRSYEMRSARRLSEIWEPPVPLPRGHPRQEEQRVQSHHAEVADFTSTTINAAPSPQAPLSTAQDPAIPGDPSSLPSHGDSNSPPEAPRPQEDEQHKAGSSSHDEELTTDIGSFPDTLTAPPPSPETAGPDDAAAEPPHRRQRICEELRKMAQAIIDLSRDHRLPHL
ncbi:uncharacterized protein FTJAE_7621 [Fusarium tjaetaba]|uniref:Uncharacterized protein n=1 Tax=Fusarium tjaetaba TaxID=1567544 RepID=A0A8H5RFD7_9HYPO|nr:uncharacterized protein FTJAE_7621 [Fusarium tjaetaba]KAF5632289.1 hypothetical protein FTJAE_7621 [Fusarium tjaetaba]